MNHINTMLEGNSDDIILCKISSNWGHALANLIRFIGLYRRLSVPSQDHQMLQIDTF